VLNFKLHPFLGAQQVSRTACAGLVALFAASGPLEAQAPGIDAAYGIWRSDTLSTVWAAGFTRPLAGPLDYGFAVTHLDDHRSVLDRTQSGVELSVGAGRDGSGLYLLGAAGIAMKHRDGNLDAFWSAGSGIAFRLLPFLSLGFEARYRVEDAASHGFWRLDPSDRRGLQLMGRASLGLGSGRRGPGMSGVPSNRSIERAARRRGVSRSALAAQIVATALDAMGTPYRWGGEGTNGYDCSGLIQFAYAEHGLTIPRVSREQAASGTSVDRSISKLAPGDILGFSVEGDQVTHVGLYIGEGQFIHSASSGVKVSSLAAKDQDSLWWQHRWSAARRILE
jgi:cell wall-associated NlpC family hydrolase